MLYVISLYHRYTCIEGTADDRHHVTIVTIARLLSRFVWGLNDCRHVRRGSDNLSPKVTIGLRPQQVNMWV
jgi:hypothetical protein